MYNKCDVHQSRQLRDIGSEEILSNRKKMSGGPNYLLLAMDMAKVGGPLSVVKVSHQIWTSQVPSPLPTTVVFR